MHRTCDLAVQRLDHNISCHFEQLFSVYVHGQLIQLQFQTAPPDDIIQTALQNQLYILDVIPNGEIDFECIPDRIAAHRIFHPQQRFLLLHNINIQICPAGIV